MATINKKLLDAEKILEKAKVEADKLKQEALTELREKASGLRKDLAQVETEISRITGKATDTKRAPNKTPATEEAILAFIGKEEKKKGDIADNFAGGPNKVNPILDALVKAKKVHVESRPGAKGPPAQIYTVK